MFVLSSVLFFWTGLHSHEGLNLRQGACLLTPSTDRAARASETASSSSGASSASLHTESCNLLFVNGQSSYAALPAMRFTQAGATFSFLLKVHSCPADHTQLLSLRASNTTSNADGVSLELHRSKGLSAVIWREHDDSRACHTGFDAIKIGAWHHVFVVIHPGSMRIWVDGALSATGDGFPNGMAAGVRNHNMLGFKVHAAIKDVRIWSVPLDVKEMEEVEHELKETYGSESLQNQI